jgi:MFS family permease
MSPAGLSIISDYFPRHKLGRAISLFMMSMYVGGALSLVAGGALVGWFNHLHAADPDALFGFAPWQATVICIALPGLFLAPLFFLLREPARRGLSGDRQRLPMRDILREFRQRRLALALLIAGMSMASIMTQAVGVWTPTLFIRVHHWGPAKAGLWLGLLMLVGSVLGSYLSGWLTDWLARQNKPDAPITVAALSFIGAGLCGLAAPLMPSPELALLVFTPLWFLQPMAFCCGPIAVQLLMPNQVRAQASGVYFTTLNLVGIALGPVVVGAMTDHLFNFPTGVRYSLAVIVAVTAPLMVVLMLLARRPYRLHFQARE